MLAFPALLRGISGFSGCKAALKYAFEAEKTLYRVDMLGVSSLPFRRASRYGAAVSMMKAQRREGQHADVVLGPCPGCDAWQLDYTDAVAHEYMRLFTPPRPELGIQVDPTEWHELLESILAEHAAECPHLQDLLVDR